LKPLLRKAGYRSAEALRHPKANPRRLLWARTGLKISSVCLDISGLQSTAFDVTLETAAG
jgi:hypothetical protein